MKILHLTPWWPASDYDSAGRFVYDQVEALRAAGHQCEVEIVNGDTWTGVVGGLLSGTHWAISGGPMVQRALEWGPDVIHAHVTWPCGWMGAKISERIRARVVVSE